MDVINSIVCAFTKTYLLCICLRIAAVDIYKNFRLKYSNGLSWVTYEKASPKFLMFMPESQMEEWR